MSPRIRPGAKLSEELLRLTPVLLRLDETLRRDLADIAAAEQKPVAAITRSLLVDAIARRRLDLVDELEEARTELEIAAALAGKVAAKQPAEGVGAGDFPDEADRVRAFISRWTAERPDAAQAIPRDAITGPGGILAAAQTRFERLSRSVAALAR